MKDLQTVISVQGGRRLLEGPRAHRPLVSIITVVFNAVGELCPLIESVFACANEDIEFLIIDGGSKDGTVELLREWDTRLDYWLSESDNGIYDAMNKGIAAATGTYVLHLNAGDRLICLPIDCLESCQLDDVDVVTFPVSIDDIYIFSPKTAFALRFVNTWHHQGTFYRREIHPGYDTSYKIFGDMHANQKLFKQGCVVKIFDTVVANHRNDGISNQSEGASEMYRSIRANFGPFYLVLAFIRFKYLGLRQRIQRVREKAPGTV